MQDILVGVICGLAGVAVGVFFGSGIKTELAALRTDLSVHVDSIVAAIKAKV